MSMLPERQSAMIGGRTLTWREAGSGPVLALVHGIGGHSGSWSHQFSIRPNAG